MRGALFSPKLDLSDLDPVGFHIEIDYLGTLAAIMALVLWTRGARLDGRHALAHYAVLWGVGAAGWTAHCRWSLHHAPLRLLLDQLAVFAAMLFATELYERSRSRAQRS